MRRQISKILPITAAVLLCAASGFAHAKLVSSSPSAGETLAVAPTSIELRFSVRVQSKMSSIVVSGPAGEAIAVGPVTESDQGKNLSVSLPPLGAGSYRVAWRALSADDHMIEGDFGFSVGQAEQAASPAAAKSVDHSGMDHSAHEPGSNINWPQSLVRWLIYIGMMLLTGGLGFRFFVARDIIFTSGAFDSRLRRILIASATMIIAGLLVALVLQTLSVTGSLDLSGVLTIVGQTSFGPPWLLQIGATAAVLLLIVFAFARRGVLPVVFALSLVSQLGPSLSGHARAAWDEYSFAILSDWLHLVAGSVWIGGLFLIGFALSAGFDATDRPNAAAGLSKAIRRFTRIVIPATIVLAVTGLYNTWIHVESFSALVGTTYGRVLLMKVAISGVMVILGGINALLLQPRLSTNADKAERRLFRNAKIEAGLAIVVLMLAAILAFLPPAREHLPIAETLPALAQEAN